MKQNKVMYDYKKKSDLAKTGLVICTLLNIVLFIGYAVLGFTVFGGSACSPYSNLFDNGYSQVYSHSQRILHDFENKQLKVWESSGTELILSATFAGRVDFHSDYRKLSVRRFNESTQYSHETPTYDHVFKFEAKSRAADLEFTMRNSTRQSSDSTGIACDSYEWRVLNEKTDSYAPQEFEDCFNLDGANWYGQAESKEQQYWPINQIIWTDYKPYLSGYIDDWGSILERYWLSTNGIALIVDRSVPLFVRKNGASLCLLASSQEPYNTRRPTVLKYDLCRIDRRSSPLDYMNKLHLYVINSYFSKPSDIPDERMFKSPIWSTWANFKANINDSVILKYATDIKNNGFSNSQLEIDDKWQTVYGDFEFDQVKFPNVAQFVTELNNLGYRTTLWIHPFTNIDSRNLLQLGESFLAVKTRNSLLPGLTSWWQGPAAAIFDTTNPNATKWFVEQLEKIRTDAKIDSFKFDAGELNWLPKNFELNDADQTPDRYCEEFARTSAQFGKLIEVRVGCGTQDLPIFVRMLDKDSTWGYDNGLKSVLTTSLTMSILGYPFILPDMIGGNAYVWNGDVIDFSAVAYPDYELYIRWAQLTAFLPSMQFSIPPWYYDDKTDVAVNQICRLLVELHETLVWPLMTKYARLATQTGEPIIRPIWWLNNTDKTSQEINDEFLIGTEILVAPVMEEKATERHVYLPLGKWRGENGREYEGPAWILNYPAPIEKIPYFIAIESQ